MSKELKNEIKYNITLNEEQKKAKALIYDNQITILTGRAGSGKSLVGVLTALNMLHKKLYKKVYISRPTVEVGHSLGFLPGDLNEKINPYNVALIENLEKCYDHVKIKEMLEAKMFETYPIQFIRGKTIDEILIIEEAQNTTKQEMLAMLTRLGVNGKIIINGDQAQRDINVEKTGLDYAIELSKKIPEIQYIKLKENHRSGLVGKILDFEYGK